VTPRRSTAEAEAALRDWARERDDQWWGLAEAAAAVERRKDLVARLLPRLLERGTLVDNGEPPRSPKRRYRWAGKPPPLPSPAHNGRRRRRDYSSAGAVPGLGQPSTAKELARVVARARARGWRIEAGSKHGRLVHPGGGRVTLSRTPSDHRTAANLEAELRRAERS
jgi:hypothetical protein